MVDNYFSIFVRPLLGNSLCLQVCPSDIISHIQTLIYKSTRIPTGLQRLVHAGIQLLNEFSLQDYGITRDATISMVYQLLGGSIGSMVNPQLNSRSFKEFVTPGLSAPVPKAFSGPTFLVEDSEYIPMAEVEEPLVYDYASLYR